MLETVKTFIKENPEKAKKIGLVVGATAGVAVVGTMLYVNRASFELPWLEVAEELTETAISE